MASSGPTIPPPSGEYTWWAPDAMSMAVTCEPNTWVTYSRPSGPNVMPLAPPSRLDATTCSMDQPPATLAGAFVYICHRSLMARTVDRLPAELRNQAGGGHLLGQVVTGARPQVDEVRISRRPA